MSTPEHAAINSYLKQIADLTKQKLEIEKRIRLTDKAVRALIDLVDGEKEQFRLLEIVDEVVRPVGLTNAIRTVLKAWQHKALTPIEVRDKVLFQLMGHSNPLASVHTVLKRLVRNDEARLTEKNGEPAYQWVDPKAKSASRFVRALTQGSVTTK